MLAIPWRSHEPTKPGVIHHQPADQAETAAKTPAIRRLYIRQDDIDTHGYVQNCPTCQHLMAHGHSTPSTVNHSAQCRARLTEATASTPAGQARLDKLTEKENRHLSEQIQQQVEGDPAAVQGGINSSSKATEAMPPISEFLPFSPVEDMTRTQTPMHGPTAEPDITPSTDEVATTTVDSHRRETEAGDMDLDLVLRHDRQDLRAAMALFIRGDRAEARTRYNDMMILVTSLGHSGRNFRREVTNRLRATVSEIYSAPRLTAAAARNPRLGIVFGIALDLTTTNNEGKPWDFNDPARRIEAEKLLDEQHPQFLCRQCARRSPTHRTSTRQRGTKR